jgi:hypothetical protein
MICGDWMDCLFVQKAGCSRKDREIEVIEVHDERSDDVATQPAQVRRLT